jgi:hypothetical protein
MAYSIFPDEESAAGVVYRDAAGLPINPPDVHNAYSPSPEFISSCLLTALPSDCDARIEPRQINAIVSEMLSFAECMNPDGLWDCTSLKNLCAAFTAYMEEHKVIVDGISIVGSGTVADPFAVGVVDCGSY